MPPTVNEALSDSDVEILYDIIHNAERNPGPQFGPALFAAYDDILARGGIAEEDGQRYFRFLLRMVAGRMENESLLSRFRHVLEEMGIHIHLGDEGEESPGDSTRVGEEEALVEDIKEAPSPLPTPFRPASFAELEREEPEELERPEDQLEMLSAAEHFNQEMLLRSVLQKFSAKQSELHRYEYLERRATIVWDCHLKHKAFTHWQTIASGEVEKTALARRHMLRWRYFNTWKVCTAVQLIKVEHFRLRKFFTLWWQQRTKVRALDNAARITNQSNLFSKYFRAWLIRFCDSRAPLWKSEDRIRKCFNAWLEQTRLRKTQERYVDSTWRPHNLERSALLLWSRRAQSLQDLDSVACEFRRHSLLSTFGTLQKSATLAPKVSQLTQLHGFRAVRSAFSIWRSHTELSVKAKRLCDTRLVRKTFVQWNDALRCRYLMQDMDIRLQVQALYKWCLAARASRAMRMLDMKNLSAKFRNWSRKTQEHQSNLGDIEDSYAASQRRLQVLSSLHRWYSALHRHQQNEERAESFNDGKLLGTACQKWHSQLENLRYLDQKASAAHFYISTTTALKLWREATQQHQRQRRREAYATVRRGSKIRLAREALGRLREAVVNIRTMERIAQEKQEDKAMRVAISTLAVWLEQTRAVLAHKQQAATLLSGKLLAKNFQTWVARHRECRRLEEAAASSNVAAVEREASNCFRRLDRRLFQIKGQEQWALQLQERHWQKHVKNMVRYWAERATALKTRGTKRPDVSGLAEDYQDEDDDEPGDGLETERRGARRGHRILSEETELDIGHLDLARLPLDADNTGGELDFEGYTFLTSTPIPGYMRTPSRRAARVKAWEKLFGADIIKTGVSTPAASGAPLQTAATAPAASSSTPVRATSFDSITPFERKLRAQGYSEYMSRRDTPKSGRLGGLHSANALTSSHFAGFEDIAEDVEPQG